jgi:hypothetical protein
MESGIWMPIARAAFMLTTMRSKPLCSTGKSAGLVP